MFMVSYVFKAFFLFLEHMKQLFYILSFNILISVWCLSRPDSVVSAVCDLIHGALYVVVFSSSFKLWFSDYRGDCLGICVFLFLPGIWEHYCQNNFKLISQLLVFRIQ